MKRLNPVLLILFVVVLGVACGGATAVPASPTAEPTAAAELTEAEKLAEAAAIVEAAGLGETDNAASATPGCEDYLRFCVTAESSGTVTAVATTGTNHYQVSNCAEWAAPGAARILELPFITAAGENQVTVALTRIGEYSGPGSYELTAVSTTGLPDMFPTIEADGRAFSHGNGATAVVTIAADGSGTLQATNLVEITTLNVSNPDPAARIDFSMQWTCKES